MTLLRTNVLANYAGQAWMALMAVAFVPVYLRILGIEAFGLVGLMLSIQAMSLALDLGMGGVMNRELSRRSVNPDALGTMGHLVRTLEWLVWPMALLIALVLWLASNWLATHWLNAEHLDTAQTQRAIVLIGVAAALQWPSSFYTNGLSGLEHQATANVINAAFATLRSAGVVVVLHFVSSTIEAFMIWFAVVGALQSLVSGVALWRAIPHGTASFQTDELVQAWQFARGLALITALSIGLMQLDRVVLSALRPLSDVGYFTLALTVAAGLGRIVQPMFNAFYPRFSRLVAKGDEKTIADLYHMGNQYLTVVVVATASVLAIFSKQVLFLWTGDAETAAIVAWPLSLLVAGSAFNGLMNLPYALQLAHGWTRLTIGLNLASLVLGIPFSIAAVSHYGVAGAAWLWLALNVLYCVVGLPLMHRRLLRGHLTRWWCIDVLPPMIVATVVASGTHILLSDVGRDASGIAKIILASAITLVATAFASPTPRARILSTIRFGHAGKRRS
ncbi:lipopolysaccharide biosynthesis protein [Pinirhizobacter soli]|uniref:lipopolysaccharide biosynthesis protein n=1 Tax=Pinirhizobacter soli TaxID=2786953 RepID=UPI002029EE06|nr:oligosaccharide flippase family protein [Pinirhizobacter soli]